MEENVEDQNAEDQNVRTHIADLLKELMLKLPKHTRKYQNRNWLDGAAKRKNDQANESGKLYYCVTNISEFV